MKYHNDITITENKRPLTGDISDSVRYYKLTEDNDVKPELTIDFLYHQLGKRRLHETGLRNDSKFSFIRESLSNNRRKTR